MNPLYIPRTVLACVGVVVDTAVRMHCQKRDYEAAVRAATPKSEQELVAPSCPLGGPCRDCDRTFDGCVQIWGPAEDHAEALRRNLIESGIAARIDKTHIVEVPYAGGAAAKAEFVLTSHPDADTQVYDLHLTIERPEYPKDPAASATAAPSPAIPPADDTDPVGVVDGPPASAAPAGPPSELAELIAAVLDAHEGHYNRASSVFECVEYHADGGLRRVPVGDDYQGWLRHVAPLIAERIEKAAPPAGLTPDDLRLAASAIYGHALAPYLRPNQATEFARLADRLHELAEHTP